MEYQVNDKNCIYNSIKIGCSIYISITLFIGFVMSIILIKSFSGTACKLRFYLFASTFKLFF